MSINKGLFTSASQHWSTPKELYEELDKEFLFNCDPCPLYGLEDGLPVPWGSSTFVNPPYGREIHPVDPFRPILVEDDNVLRDLGAIGAVEIALQAKADHLGVGAVGPFLKDVAPDDDLPAVGDIDGAAVARLQAGNDVVFDHGLDRPALHALAFVLGA